MKLNKELNIYASHFLSYVILKNYPESKLGMCDVTDEGFYCDFEFSQPLSNTDLPKILKLLFKLAKSDLVIKQTSNESLNFSNQKYRQELLNDAKENTEKINFFGIFDRNEQVLFQDFSTFEITNFETKNIKHLELLNVGGVYWKSDSKNQQLTRIYGTCWDSKEDLEQFLTILKDRKERDHRKIGKDLGIFTFSKYFGLGFPVWLENGMKIHNKIKKKILFLDRKYGFKEVSTPHFGQDYLYKISGHLEHYKDDMFNPIQMENDSLYPRPMTCPHHIILFDQLNVSYRQLPLRISEQSRLYRYEKSGALTGLERVRSMELTEGHIFISKSQIYSEFSHLFKMIFEGLKLFDIEIDYISFSKRDPKNKEKFFDNEEMWTNAESSLKQILDDNKIKYVEKIGEAAFYGPKIDFQIKTVMQKEITVSTLQLDFLLPSKFNISFTNELNQKETPILIHRGLIGTYERFISVLLEQTKGVLPFWLSPNQICVIPVTNEHIKYAKSVYQNLFDLGFEVEFDDRNERISKKIRDAQIQKVKYQIIIGDEEIAKNGITYRRYGQEQSFFTNLEDFIKQVDKERV